MDAWKNWMIIHFTPYPTMHHPTKMDVLPNTFAQLRPPKNSDDPCLLFCCIHPSSINSNYIIYLQYSYSLFC